MKALRLLPLLAFMALGSCATTPPVVITARSITALNYTFVGTVKVINAAHDQHRISDADYARFKDFGLRFQASAELAEKLWDAAEAQKDLSVRAHAEAILRSFAEELDEYVALGVRIAHPDGGS